MLAGMGGLWFCLGNLLMHELTAILRRRTGIIADHSWRDRDAAGHLEALRIVSEEITAWALAHRTEMDARLRHYLANASYEKALAHVEAQSEE